LWIGLGNNVFEKKEKSVLCYDMIFPESIDQSLRNSLASKLRISVQIVFQTITEQLKNWKSFSVSIQNYLNIEDDFLSRQYPLT